MKRIGLLFALGLLAAGASTSALARTHVAVGIGVGAPVGWGYGYHYGPYPYYPPYPYYYPPQPVVVVPPAPVTYIESAPMAPAVAPEPAAPANSWYYCAKPQGYYPYVKECPGGWRTVAPQPQQ